MRQLVVAWTLATLGCADCDRVVGGGNLAVELQGPAGPILERITIPGVNNPAFLEDGAWMTTSPLGIKQVQADARVPRAGSPCVDGADGVLRLRLVWEDDLDAPPVRVSFELEGWAMQTDGLPSEGEQFDRTSPTSGMLRADLAWLGLESPEGCPDLANRALTMLDVTWSFDDAVSTQACPSELTRP